MVIFRSSLIVTNVADFGPASLISRPWGLPGITMGPAPFLKPLMNVAERPVVEARAMEVRKAAGRVKSVGRRTAKTRMHHADIHGSGKLGAELRQEALGRMLLREADAMQRNLDPPWPSDTTSARPAKTLTDSGKVNSRVIRDSAS